jgi:hypothetical protein
VTPGVELAWVCGTVASIRVRVRGGKRRVTISGRLSAADLRRLERACGSALEHEEIPLEIRIRDAVAVDDVSRLFLSRLLKRGAVLA